MPQQVQVQHRMGRDPRMAHIEPQGAGADSGHGEGGPHRYQFLPQHGEAEDEAGKPDAGQDEALQVQRRYVLFAHILDEAGGQEYPQHPDGHVDEEDQPPVEIGGDEAAQGRAEHRPQQGGNGEPRQSRHQFRLRHRAQDDEAPHRHHHGPAHALDDAVEHEIGERGGEPAQDRADGEDDDGRAEYRARAIAVRRPAARRNEDGQRKQIGGERQLERHRVFLEISGDGGQGGGDDGRVHLFHEQGTGDDEGDENLRRQRVARHVCFRRVAPRSWAARRVQRSE